MCGEGVSREPCSAARGLQIWLVHLEKLQTEAISASEGAQEPTEFGSIPIKAGSNCCNLPGKLQDEMEEERLRVVNHAVRGISEDAPAQVVVLPKVGRHFAYDGGENKIAPRV